MTEVDILKMVAGVFGEDTHFEGMDTITLSPSTSIPPEEIVMKLRVMGYAFFDEGGIGFNYCRKGNPPREAILLLEDLKAHLVNGWTPKDPCLFCQACGNWPGHEGGPFCFYDAVYRGKPNTPQPIEKARERCPKLERKG